MDSVIVKIITKTYWYDYRKDSVLLRNIEVDYVETSPREALDLIVEVNSKMTDGETLLELASSNCKLVTCYATME